MGRVDAADQPGGTIRRTCWSHAADWQETSLDADPPQAEDSAGTVLAAAIREVQEESGLTIEPADLAPLGQLDHSRGHAQAIRHLLLCSKAVAQPPTAAPNHGGVAVPVDAGGGILEAEAAGSLKIMPPTYYLLKEIAGFSIAWMQCGPAEHSVAPVLAPPGSLAAFLKERENRG